jgi:hypothetical protein
MKRDSLLICKAAITTLLVLSAISDTLICAIIYATGELPAQGHILFAAIFIPLALASANILILVTARSRLLKGLSLFCILVLIAIGVLIGVANTAPPVEFHPQAMLGICAVMFGYPLAGILSLVSGFMFIQEACTASVKKGLCVKCGYDLTGNVSGVCPECGEKI